MTSSHFVYAVLINMARMGQVVLLQEAQSEQDHNRTFLSIKCHFQAIRRALIPADQAEALAQIPGEASSGPSVPPLLSFKSVSMMVNLLVLWTLVSPLFRAGVLLLWWQISNVNNVYTVIYQSAPHRRMIAKFCLTVAISYNCFLELCRLGSSAVWR